MPRIRSLKPGFFKNEVLCEMSPWHRLAFQGLWVCADREGRLEDRPKRLKVEIFPYDDLNMDAIIWDLSRAGFVIRYVVDGRRLIWIPTFLNHQHPRQDEADSVLLGFEQGTERLSDAAPTVSVDSHAIVTDPSLSRDEPATVKRMVTGVLDLGTGNRGLGDARASRAPAQDLVDAWNEVTHLPIPRCREITKERRRKIQARMQERPDLAEWRDIFGRVEASSFCRGEIPGRNGSAPWVADFDWIIANDTNPAKVLEGKYDERSPPTQTRDGRDWSRWQDDCPHTTPCGSPTICENLKAMAAYKAEHRATA